jgi:hypothetical protein
MTHRTTRRALATALALGGLGLIGVGCGGGSSPSVASLTTTTAATATTAPDEAVGGATDGGPSTATGGGGRGLHLTMRVGDAGVEYATCMRKHGVPKFPDPSADGSISIGSGSGIDPQSPTFQRADATCRKLLPHGGQPTQAEQAKAQKQALAFSACMRAHGVPNFPDPQFSGGRARLQVKRGGGLDPSSPAFQGAQKACQKDLPGAPGSQKGAP